VSRCECDKPGFCPRYNRPMAGRLRDICRGEAAGLSAAQYQAYRELWAQQATGQPPPPARVRPCRYLGRRARDGEGKVRKRPCGVG
jgi:hypothetical protein